MFITWLYFWLAAVFVLSLLFLLLPRWKGASGEGRIAAFLRKLPQEEYQVINNIMLQSSDRTVQIDHIVVSRYGIFVIETKNYKGWISGNENSDQWVQNIYGHKSFFKNPIHQNYGHIKTLEQLLENNNIKYISIVAFAGNCRLAVKAVSHVVFGRNVNAVILGYQVPILDRQQAEHITRVLKENNIDSPAKRKEHVKQVREIKQARNEKLRQGICPRCGGALVRREGKYGIFYGCANYPRCRFTKK